MTGYIRREAAVEIAMRYCPDDDGSCSEAGTDLREMLDELEAIPAADVREVRMGRWVDTNPTVPDWSNKKDDMAYYCSSCLHRAGKYKHKTYKFCPWCGVEMVAEDDVKDYPPYLDYPLKVREEQT